MDMDVIQQRVLSYIFINLFFLFSLHGQKEITLDDIWVKNTFSQRSVPGFYFDGEGREYLRRNGNTIEKFDLLSGQKTGVLLDGSQIKTSDGKPISYSSYTKSPDERYFLLETASQSIYRYSRKAKYLLWDTQLQRLSEVQAPDLQMYPQFSPDSRKIAFVCNNNLYVFDITSGKTKRLTKDGVENSIINGASDWVYEEEFTLTRAYEWSPDSRQIAFIRLDETMVPTFTMEMYEDDMYPRPVSFKYPKVGEKNAVVSLHLCDVNSGKIKNITLPGQSPEYLPRIMWCSKGLITFAMNRHQNELTLFLSNPKTLKSDVLLHETNPYYIEIQDYTTILPNQEGFIWVSEKDGWRHLYWYGMDGKERAQITKGTFDVTDFYGYDQKSRRIYFQAAAATPLQREVYSGTIQGGEMKRLSTEPGWNTAQFSPDFNYFVNTHSTIDKPATYAVYDLNGNALRSLESNEELIKKQQEYQAVKAEFFTFNTSDGTMLNGYMIKPPGFSAEKKYPVFMFLYGGPDSQQAVDNWRGTNYWWFQMLAQKGYIVACVDNRGTGARGQEFRKSTYLKLGHYETLDQIEAARYLGSLPYTDASRIGIYGWSYGGYMSSLCLLKGEDVFKAAIAVAPVTNWKWYDTIYTERYMRTEKENPNGYKENSPVYFADRLKGNYLLIHGMADDNVHFQHAVEMSGALIRANKQFDTYYYPNKNHGIYGGTARIHLFTKMTNFILDNL
jgi:dipeptidyl-peptidase-4